MVEDLAAKEPDISLRIQWRTKESEYQSCHVAFVCIQAITTP